jgi:hypothetical protein
MKDPALEVRARALSAELRCIVCQNQSIDDFDAPLTSKSQKGCSGEWRYRPSASLTRRGNTTVTVDRSSNLSSSQRNRRTRVAQTFLHNLPLVTTRQGEIV